MSLPVNNKNAGKKGGKAKTNNVQGSKFIAKPAKAAGSIKPVKTGGSRGSWLNGSTNNEKNRLYKKATLTGVAFEFG